MGEEADYIIDQILEGPDAWSPSKRFRKRFQKRVGLHKWRTANGTIISMRDMTTEHIFNAIKICETRSNSGKKQELMQILQERSQE